MTGRQLIAACVLLLVIPAPALPQTAAASFDQLIAEDAIQPRQTVYVTDVWGHRVKARLGELRSGRLVLTQGPLQIPMTEAAVSRIQRADSLQNGLWLGLGAGVAAAWIAPYLFCDLPTMNAPGSFLRPSACRRLLPARLQVRSSMPRSRKRPFESLERGARSASRCHPCSAAGRPERSPRFGSDRS